jgi:hypothetical protein
MRRMISGKRKRNDAEDIEGNVVIDQPYARKWLMSLHHEILHRERSSVSPNTTMMQK